MKIGFFDPVSKKPYDKTTLLTEPMGGTEATVVRVAEGLAQRGHDVFVSQRARFTESRGDVWYREWTTDKPDVAVVLRNPEAIDRVNGKAKVMWRHDWYAGAANPADKNPNINAHICVSDTHVQNLADAGVKGCLRIYNPVDERLESWERREVKPYKLIFPCSPHKGLEETVWVFLRLARLDSRFRLYIANPGYFGTRWIHTKNIFTLGPLPFDRLMKHVSESLAILCVNNVFPETFGLVYAEANAVGTPAVGVNYGAVPEVAQGRLFDHKPNLDEVAASVLAMIDDRPMVRLDERFRLSNVLNDWEALFERIADAPASERLPSQIGA